MNKMNPVVHFEMPAEDRKRMSDFYSNVFGWQTKLLGEEMPAQYPSIVISVDNIKESIQKVTKAKGKVLGEPMEIPGVGIYISFIDTEGNQVSLLQPIM